MSDSGNTDSLELAAELVSKSPREALAPLRRVFSERPGDREALRLLKDALRALGEPQWERKAQELAISAETDHPDLVRASDLMRNANLDEAERILKARTDGNATDVRAMRLLAVIANKRHKRGEAERILLEVMAVAPDFDSARYELAVTQYELGKFDESLSNLDRLIPEGLHTAQYMRLKAAALSRAGRYENAARVHQLVLAQEPEDQRGWILYGHALRILNRVPEAISAYRQAIAVSPMAGQAWWSLANIKTASLNDEDVEAMERSLRLEGLTSEDRMPIHFALGKAHEDRSEAAAAFENYRAGNALAAEAQPYSPATIDELVRRSKEVLTAQVLAEDRTPPTRDVTPIFVVGMPRAGSTLVEQILASHSRIEATWELPYLVKIAKFLGAGTDGSDYPANLPGLFSDQLADLGNHYLKQAGAARSQSVPFFVDKNPNNWRYVGLIRMILPEAKIIDVRRHPLDCGFSNFRQLYAQGHEFSYSLEGIGHYYSRYVELMAHWDEVAPRVVHRIIYEDLVEEPEREIRALLEFIGVEFEEACLNFHDTRRMIRTPSSEQVQQPINRSGIGQWRQFDEWLGPLKQALGPLAERHRGN